jgi:predicted AAA+ superfamily ATPase
MERILIEQNPWWGDPRAIERDKHLLEYMGAKIKFPIPELEIEKGVYILRGPRQVGKTTLIKGIIKEKLKKAQPDSVFFFSAESGYPLEKAIREFLDFSGAKTKAMFLDEVTGDGLWATKIKYLIDSGKITDKDLVVATGSSSIDLKAGAERLPGRHVEGREYLFYPYSFRDYTGSDAPACGILDFDINVAKKLHLDEGIRADFFQYIRNGGLPSVWNTEHELAKERYARWIEGMVSKARKSVLYARELLTKLPEKSTFDFSGLAKETSIKSHHTVEDYLSFFEAGMIGKLLYNYSLATNNPDPKKEKKFVFLDPFICQIFSEKRSESAIVEDIIGSHLLRISDHLHFYRDKRGEIDFLCEIGDQLIPVEVKWQNEVTKSDALHMRKFGKGFLITKDKFAVFGDVIAVPAFVFLTLTGKTITKRRIL